MNPNDPLSQLRDIHLPEAIGWWPLAPGWWIVATLLVAAIGITVFILIRKKRANRYRIEAINILNQLWENYQGDKDGATYLYNASQLLRRTAIAAFPNLSPGILYGQDWLEFLDQSANFNIFQQGDGKPLATLPYEKPQSISLNNPQATLDTLEGINKSILQWLQLHRIHCLKNIPSRGHYVTT